MLVEELGADKEAKGEHGETPLHWAACNGQAEALRVMVQLGADKEAKNLHKGTPLHFATSFGHVEAVEMLVHLGADKEAKDEDGWTPLLGENERALRGGGSADTARG